MVNCSDVAITVYFNKTALDERTDPSYNNRSYAIKFANSTSPGCRVDVGDNSTVGAVNLSPFAGAQFISIGTEYNVDMCGIELTYDNDYIYYNTTITVTYGQNPNPMIIREEYDNYVVTCLRNRTVETNLDQYNVQSRLAGYDKQSKCIMSAMVCRQNYILRENLKRL